MNRFTAVFERRSDGRWTATVEQIPGSRTQGETLEEVLCKLGGAAELILEALEERAFTQAPDEQIEHDEDREAESLEKALPRTEAERAELRRHGELQS